LVDPAYGSLCARVVLNCAGDRRWPRLRIFLRAQRSNAGSPPRWALPRTGSLAGWQGCCTAQRATSKHIALAGPVRVCPLGRVTCTGGVGPPETRVIAVPPRRWRERATTGRVGRDSKGVALVPRPVDLQIRRSAWNGLPARLRMCRSYWCCVSAPHPGAAEADQVRGFHSLVTKLRCVMRCISRCITRWILLWITLWMKRRVQS